MASVKKLNASDKGFVAGTDVFEVETTIARPSSVHKQTWTLAQIDANIAKCTERKQREMLRCDAKITKLNALKAQLQGA